MLNQALHTLLALIASVVCLAAVPGIEDAAASNTRQQSEAVLNMVEATPTSKVEPAKQPQGQSKPGTGESVAGKNGKQPLDSVQPVPPKGWTDYVDSTFGFSIHYPNGFVAQPQDVSMLTQFIPTPLSSIFFMNPTMAAGDLAGIEPPDLEVRVYQAGAANSLKSWLASVGFASEDSGANIQPYRNVSVNGLKVCQSTMIFPGCSIYALKRGRVYQLTAGSLEGEAMIETFALLP